MPTEHHRKRVVVAALLALTGAIAVLGATTGHAVVGWLAAITPAIVAGVIVMRPTRRR